jgi:dipeptidyl aminopeptidase/acylaminoacyl peptidase
MLTGDGPKGSKSLSWTNMPPKLAKVGISSFLFDFEGLGFSEGSRENLTLTVGLDNFKTAYEVVKKQEWIDSSRIGAFSSSFGSTVLLLSPDIANEMRAIGLKSPAAFIPDAYYKEIGREEFENWRKKGFSERNGYKFEVLLDSLKYNTYYSAFSIKAPCLITQGENDEIISLQHTLYLFECLQSKEKRIEIFNGVGHGYSEGDAWERMASIFVNWFNEKLNS